MDNENLKVLHDEMDEMENSLESLERGPEPTNAPGTESPSTSAPVSDVPVDELSTEAPATTVDSTDAPGTEVPEDPRDKELRELREEIDKLKNPPKSTEAPPTKAPATEAPIEDVDFFADKDDVDFDNAKEVFNTVLNSMRKEILKSTRGNIREANEILAKSIPDIVKNTTVVNAQMKQLRENFYKENEDLKGKEDLVAMVFEKVASESPDKTYAENLKTTAERARKLSGTVKQKKKEDDNPPSLPKKKGSQRQTPKPDPTGLESEMDEMDKALGL